MDWKGVMPALTTKFTAADDLDLGLFEINVRAQVEAGVSGLILGGTLGEASTLYAEEKSILTRTACELVEGRIPIVVNIAEQRTRLRNGKHLPFSGK